MDQVSLRAEPRTDFGTRPSRRARLAGTVPGVVYGRGLDPVAVSVPRRELHAALHTDAGTNALINLEVAGSQNFLTVAREIQRHPVRGDIVHLDFINISLDEKIHAEVGLEFIGVPVGVRVDAGILETIRGSVEVLAFPMDIPSHIPLDVSAMEVGDNLKVSDLAPIDGVEFVDDPDTDLVSVIIPRVVEAAAVEAAVGEAEEGAGAAEAAADGGAESTESPDEN